MAATNIKLEIEAFKLLKVGFNFDEGGKYYHSQKSAIKEFMAGKNIYFSAPTGFGKSLVFQSVPWYYDTLHEQVIGTSTLLVISPLKALIEDQITFLRTKTGVSAIALNEEIDDEKFQDIQDGVYSLVYTCPESLLKQNRWRKLITSSTFRDHCIGVVIDEAHVMIEWGQASDSSSQPFRLWYSKLLELRSLLSANVKFLLFTATASHLTESKIFSMLDLLPKDVYMEVQHPNKNNIMYKVEYIGNPINISDHFDNVIDTLTKQQEKAPRILIYCQTRKKSCLLYNGICSKLGDNMYLKGFVGKPKYRLIEMFHALTPDSTKSNIIKGLTDSQNHLRYLVCTSAFGMGVDVKGVNKCIHFGPSTSIESYIQESGRIGRNGLPSLSVLMYNNSMLRNVSEQIKNYVSSDTCRRSFCMEQFPGKYHPPTDMCMCKFNTFR